MRSARITIAGSLAALAAGAALALAAASGPHHAAPPSAPAATRQMALTAAAPAYCTGATLARLPAVNGITNASGTEGGHLWWRAQPGGTCIGTVVVDVRSGITRGSETLRVIVYDSQHPGGLAVITDVIPAPAPGYYEFSFGVHRVFPGLSAVCVGAVSCVTFGG